MELICPHCDQLFRIPDSAEGKKVGCPTCRKVVPTQAITSRATGTRSGGAAPPPIPRHEARVDLDWDDEDDHRDSRSRRGRRDEDWDEDIPPSVNWPVIAILSGAGLVFLLVIGLVCWIFLSGGAGEKAQPKVAAAPSAPAKKKNDPPAPGPKPAPSQPAPSQPNPGPINPVPKPNPRPIHPPPKPKPKRPTYPTKKITLRSKASDMAVGGNGRYFLYYMPTARSFAIVDVHEEEIVRYISPSPVEHFAAGATKLVVHTSLDSFEVWDFTTGKRDHKVSLPLAVTEDKIRYTVMGCNSDDWVFFYLEKKHQTLALNLKSLAKNGRPQFGALKWTDWRPGGAYGPLNLRVSANGDLLVGFGGGWWGVNVTAIVNGRQQPPHKNISISVSDTLALTPDAKRIYTRSTIYTPQGNVLQKRDKESRGIYVVPSQDSDFVVGLSLPNPSWSFANKIRGEIHYRSLSDPTIYSASLGPQFTVEGCDELRKGTNLPWEKRVHYYHKSKTLVTLSHNHQDIYIRKVKKKGR